jgi:hypothetical protein
MRTTVTIEDRLLARAKAEAARRGSTVGAVIEDALRQALSRPAGRSRARKVSLPTVGGLGLRAGVDLDDSAGLQELMDEGE